MAAPRRVLVVDDDESVRLRVHDLLGRGGDMQVDDAPDGLSGIERARAWAPDLILLDIMMPGMTGLEVCRILRADTLTREIPIIVLSAANESESLIAAIEAGAEDYLPKPFSSAELRAKAHTITRLDRYAALARERRQLRWLVENSRDAMVIVTPEGRQVFANKVACEWFALTEAAGGDLWASVGAHFQADPVEAWPRSGGAQLAPGARFALVRPESVLAAARWLEVEAYGGGGEEGELLVKFSDRTEGVRQALMVWSFQHVIAHKLRTPMNGLGNVLGLVAACPGLVASPEHASLLTIARKNAERLESSLLSILRYHEALCEAQVREEVGVELSGLALCLTEAADAVGLPMDRLLMAGADDPVVPDGWAGPVSVSVGEIVENYVKFSDARRSGLSVRVWREGRQVGVEFWAPGPVVPVDLLSAMGRPYWQAEGRFTGEVPGMGLGLATVRVLMRSLGGEITFANRSNPSGMETVLKWSLPAYV